jgi:hypothetical protein
MRRGGEARRRAHSSRHRRANDHWGDRRSRRVRQLPLRVEIDAGNVGGPSAELPFALDVLGGSARSITAASRDRPVSWTAR